MLKVGDTVKVISKTMYDGEEKELIPIGTICKVTEICKEDDNSPYYGITPKDRDYTFYYLENELEKGELVWVPEQKSQRIVLISNSYGSKCKINGTYYINESSFDGDVYVAYSDEECKHPLGYVDETDFIREI